MSVHSAALRTTDIQTLYNMRRLKPVDVNGARIYYEMTGKGNHTLLLLPGALGSAQADFALQLANMNKDMFTLIGFDPRGYGKSRPPERDWSNNFLERDADDAIRLLEVLGESHKELHAHTYSLVGWSDGGIAAMIIAAKRPERVRKLITWGANAYVTKEDMAIFEKYRNPDTWSEKMRSALYSVYGEEFARKHWSYWVDAFGKFVTDNDGDVCKGWLSKIKCPTLILHGSKDPLCLPAHPEYLEKHIANAKVLHFPEGKHNVHMKYFKQFNSLVEEFLITPEK